MDRIIVEPSTAPLLVNLDQVAEIYGEDGQMLGHFIPLNQAKRSEPPVSDEGTDRHDEQAGLGPSNP